MLEKYKKKTVKKKEWEEFTSQDEEASKKYQKEFDHNNNLYNFKKIFKIPSFITIDNKFYNIEPAYPVKYDDINKSAELEDVERNHKMKFDACKTDINNLVLDPGKTNPIFVFLFVFDLGNFASFEKIKIYYEELNRIYNIKDKYKQVLIGNKSDLASTFCDSERDKISNFVTENNFADGKYIQISTKMITNFEFVYKNLIYNLFKIDYKTIVNKFFIESFDNILNSKESFSKSQRSSLKVNKVPGPEKYDSNPYDISTKESKYQHIIL